MQNQPSITVFPESGYRNTTFAIRSAGFSNTKTIKIYRNGHLISSNTVSNGDLIYQRALEPAAYMTIISDDSDGEVTAEFIVQDSIQIGSSVVKSSYLFPAYEKVFIVKRDRTLLYDTALHNSLVLNSVSPDSIILIGQDCLLFETKISFEKNVSNFGIFCLRTLNFIRFYEKVRKITHRMDVGLLWLYDPDALLLAAVNLQTPRNEQNYKFTLSGKVLSEELSNEFLLLENDQLNIVDLDACDLIIKLGKSPCVAVSVHQCIIAQYRNDRLEIRTFFSSITPLIKVSNDYLIDAKFDWKGSAFVQDKNTVLEQNKLQDTARRHARFLVMPSSVRAGERLEFIFEPASGLQFERTIHQFYRVGKNVYRIRKQIVTTFSGTATAVKSLKFNDEENVLMNFSLDSVISETFTINHYKGIDFSFYSQLSIKKLQVAVSSDQAKGILTIFDGENKFSVVTDGAITFEIPDITTRSEPEIIFLSGLGHYILKSISGGATELYKIESRSCRKLLDINSKVYFPDYIREHHLLWLRNTGQHPKIFYEVFDIANECFVKLDKQIPGSEPPNAGSSYSVNTAGKFEKGYFLTGENVIVSLRPFAIKSAVAGRIIGHSANLSAVLTYLDDKGYQLYQYHQEQERYLALTIGDPDLRYDEAQLLPNGQFALLRTTGTNEIQVFDIEKQRVVSFFTGTFLGFTNDGSVILEESMHRAVKVFDPYTFDDITPAQYHFYRHLSPDGKLFSQRSRTAGFYNFVRHHSLTADEFKVFQNRYSRHTGETQQDFEIRYKQNLLTDGGTRYHTFHQYNFMEHRQIAREVTFIEIGIVGTDVTAQLPAERLKYYNYVAFSYDNKFVGYVGKPEGTGLFQLFKIDFNEAANTLKVVDYITHRDPSLATWVCAFSKGNYFGTYDSDPNTFIVRVDDTLFERKGDPETIRRHTKKLRSKSFECFSPEGSFLALSEKGYEPLSLGGRGHMNSKDLYIAKTDTGNIFRHFSEHGDNVKFAAFSADGKRLLSSSRDGVVIIRDIQLEE